ncbi:MAG TPA: PaaI family thioesterase [Pyrinomonadaceae bacterium]|nr:PaaI family thioesterase [Pyrinomonadaceae bacterium]
MTTVHPQDAEYESRVRQNFSRQPVMKLIGADLRRVEPGAIDIALPYRLDLTQQNSYLHAGILTTVADSACGYAAYTLMPAGADVLSVEFKMNLLRPAIGDLFVAEARVLKAGRTLTVVRCDVYAQAGDETKMVATMLATIIRR